MIPQSRKQILILICSIVLIVNTFVFSCKKDLSDEPAMDTIDMLYEKDQDPPTLDNFYFLPSTKDKIFEYKPEIIEQILNNTLLLQTYQEELGVDLKEEIIKYLNRKKNYDKSKIFSDVP